MGLTRLPIWLGDEHPCPYLPDQDARLGWIDPRAPLTQSLYTSLLQAGFRRSGETVYQPRCGGCRACIPLRIPVMDFSPNRSQRRTWRRNVDLRIRLRRAEFSTEHDALYRRYQQMRHPDGAMAGSNRDEILDFLRCSWLTTWFIEFRRGIKLVAVAVTDALDDGLSCVYTFYDPDEAATGPGIFAILYQIRLAKTFGLPWCYLGYWIAENRKMSYKHQFRPVEARLRQRWIRFDHGGVMNDAPENVL